MNMKEANLTSLNVSHTEKQPQKALVEGMVRVFAYEIRAYGIQNLQETQRLIQQGNKVVIISNHLSNADYPVIMQSLKSNGFPKIANNTIPLQGIKLERNPLTKFLARANKAIHTWPKTVPARNEKERKEQFSMNRKAIKYTKQALNSGYHLLIFPEGTRSRNGKLQEAILETPHYFNLTPNTLILPIAVFGTEKLLRPGIPFPIPHTPNVAFGKPIIIDDLTSKYKHLSNKDMRNSIVNFAMLEIAKLLPPQYRGFYA